MTARNILFIMCDQLRFDYLGCTGHPTLETPNIDALAARGVRFDRAYVQSPICGPSRMSFYTGRYVRSHGSTWNGSPLRVGEMTLGEHLAPLGVRSVLCGKTHMVADRAGMARLGIAPDSVIGARVAECGFEVWERFDGLYPSRGRRRPENYNAYLRARGYDDENPWETWANSAEGDDGEVLSGWLLGHNDRPARVAEPDSETPWTTSRAIEFIDETEGPWCLHLSYIKPHWPYVVPEPYASMYGPEDVPPPVRSEAERRDAHPVLAGFQQHRVSRAFSDEAVRRKVIPAYMGLIRQIDDQIGRLMAHLDSRGLTEDTLIVFTSDHGDYLGDHWLGEKELFHDASVRIPLIVVDPDRAADVTRGTVSETLVEAIDLVPTFVDWYEGEVASHILEGHSLLPALRGADQTPRAAVFSEYDYAFRLTRRTLGQEIADSRLIMVFDGRWKMIHAVGFPPMLYDLDADPDELHDLGRDPDHAAVRTRLCELLLDWATRHHNRVTRSDAEIEAASTREFDAGIWIGFIDEDDVAEAERDGHGGN
ncbi:phosphonate monoester hydrolase [Rhodosalinus halophilus]|uniref:Phosphonate monoester hydrolase n=1 Tax=Rhodosalinus halophilus TaxID=2259333 RepID=A0A365U7E8_9RHOB|nr:alkaline phosphatase family protein [Rhodosalinus halophilus]RBI83770.1 phosphonate monoester hydrolase [Rhodosalinus halophilus]